MGYIENLLGRNERAVFTTRQHWFQLVFPAWLRCSLSGCC